jgi:hypothetical protein
MNLIQPVLLATILVSAAKGIPTLIAYNVKRRTKELSDLMVHVLAAPIIMMYLVISRANLAYILVKIA